MFDPSNKIDIAISYLIKLVVPAIYRHDTKVLETVVCHEPLILV